jgi:pimeloyl-ACP methyl ester carboxylesterase
MGAYTALQIALHHPDRCRSVVVASGGSGAYPPTREAFLAECHTVADNIEQSGRFPAEQMGRGPTRVQLLNKDPDRWRTFVDHAAEHPAKAAAMILRQVQARRPSLYDLEDSLRAVTVPVLLMVGDEDESCLDVNLHLKRIMPAARLVMLPGTGHLLNLEEPGLFDRFVGEFLRAVDAGTWRPRDPSSLAAAGKAATALGLVEEG